MQFYITMLYHIFVLQKLEERAESRHAVICRIKIVIVVKEKS